MRRLGLVRAATVATVLGSAAFAGGISSSAAATCAVHPETMTAPDCTLLRTDTAAQKSATAGLWGLISCAESSRHLRLENNGDLFPTATGAAQLNTQYRRLKVINGDDVDGERCELGRNERRNGENGGTEDGGTKTDGTFALYREGQRRITFFSERYPSGFQRNASMWQTVMQMKQTQKAAGGGGGPIVELQLHDGRLDLDSPGGIRWSTRAPPANTWVRYALDVVYSIDRNIGAVTMYVDLNGDGDAEDLGEQSPRTGMRTLKPEIAGGEEDGLGKGDPIPSHLRLGVYHHADYHCPPPTGCRIDIDNVQVMRPPSSGTG